MEAAENSERQRRTPLGEVVSDCVRRWFQDTLKEAKNGDIAMQVLVGQMYTSGFGVGKDAQKVFDAFRLLVLCFTFCLLFLIAEDLTFLLFFDKSIHKDI